MHRIIQKSIVGRNGVARNGLDFNTPSASTTWRSVWELTLDDGRRIALDGLGFSSGRRSDGNALFVPATGDWIYWEEGEPRVFQFIQVVQVLNDTLHLSNGERCSARELYGGSAIPVKGDYLVRRTDGLCVVQQRYFEEQNASLIAYMKQAEKDAEAKEKKRLTEVPSWLRNVATGKRKFPERMG